MGRFKREGTYVYLRLIHVVVWAKPTQYCKAIILQLKINNKKAPKNKYHIDESKKKKNVKAITTIGSK